MFTPAAPSHARLLSAERADWLVHPEWQDVLGPFWCSKEGLVLLQFLRERLAAGAVVYPPQPLHALALVAPRDVRVVILGQDPYHGPGQAEGLAFSVAHGVRFPPSLRNIFKELQRDLGLPPPTDGSLSRWAQQGVLLLNTCLTVEAGRPGSHAGRGWEVLTDRLLAHIVARGRTKIFLLWGSHAQKKAKLLFMSDHSVLCANHPSPLSAARGSQPFMGCGHFGTVNRWLAARGEALVRW